MPLPLGRRNVLFGISAVSVASAAGAKAGRAAGPARQDQGPEERRALAVIDAWVAALLAKDAERALALMDEQCQYRDDPFQTELKKGLVQAGADIRILLRGLTGMRIETAYAVGSAKNDVLVLARRTDSFNLFGKIVTLPIGAYFRVRNGKILEWLDTPLADMPPPPAGALPKH